MKLQECAEAIDNVIKNLGVDPATTRDPLELNIWHLKFGASKLTINTYLDDDDNAFFLCFATISGFPETNLEAFLEEILELNFFLFESTMCAMDNEIILQVSRTTTGLDETEIRECILRVGEYAEEYKALFNQKYVFN